MEAEGKLHPSEVPGATTSGEHGPTATDSGEHGATATGSGEHGATATGSSDHGPTASGSEVHPSTGTSSGSGAPSTGHKLAKRAIESIQSIRNEDDYNPMMIQFNEQQQKQTILQKPQSPSIYSGYLTLGKYAIELLTFTTLQLINNNDNDSHLLSSNDSSTLSTHHFMKRSGAASEESQPLTDEEKIFVYKTFLIFGGGIIIVNSLIKFLNTKISGTYIIYI